LLAYPNSLLKWFNILDLVFVDMDLSAALLVEMAPNAGALPCAFEKTVSRLDL
jgi:hypothetical protein